MVRLMFVSGIAACVVLLGTTIAALACAIAVPNAGGAGALVVLGSVLQVLAPFGIFTCLRARGESARSFERAIVHQVATYGDKATWVFGGVGVVLAVAGIAIGPWPTAAVGAISLVPAAVYVGLATYVLVRRMFVPWANSARV